MIQVPQNTAGYVCLGTPRDGNFASIKDNGGSTTLADYAIWRPGNGTSYPLNSGGSVTLNADGSVLWHYTAADTSIAGSMQVAISKTSGSSYYSITPIDIFVGNLRANAVQAEGLADLLGYQAVGTSAALNGQSQLGPWRYQGSYNNQSLFITPNGSFVWADNVVNLCWVISAVPGTYGTSYFTGSTPNGDPNCLDGAVFSPTGSGASGSLTAKLLYKATDASGNALATATTQALQATLANQTSQGTAALATHADATTIEGDIAALSIPTTSAIASAVAAAVPSDASIQADVGTALGTALATLEGAIGATPAPSSPHSRPPACCKSCPARRPPAARAGRPCNSPRRPWQQPINIVNIDSGTTVINSN